MGKILIRTTHFMVILKLQPKFQVPTVSPDTYGCHMDTLTSHLYTGRRKYVSYLITALCISYLQVTLCLVTAISGDKPYRLYSGSICFRHQPVHELL